MVVLLTASLPGPAAGRAFTVDDLLEQASFGPAVVDPRGRWLVFEQRDPYRAFPRFDYSTRNDAGGSRLRIVDLTRPGPARPLLAGSDGPGDMALAASPDGGRLAIQRLSDRTLRLGVVTVATGAVRWLPLTPEEPYLNRSVQWRSDHELLVLARADGDLPLLYRVGGQSAAALPERWATTAAGGVAATVIGSGAARGDRARPKPRRLLAVDVRTGAQRELARGELVDFELSPDGRRIALLETAEDLQPQAGKPVQAQYGLQTERRTLSLLDLRSGARSTPLPDADVLDSLLSWRPDGGELMVFARPPGAPWTDGGLRRIDPAGAATPVLPPHLSPDLRLRPERVSAGWMGLDPVVLARAASSPDGRADWVRIGRAGPVRLTAALPAAPSSPLSVTRGGISFLQDGVLYSFDPDGRRLRAEPSSGFSAMAWPRPVRMRRLNAALTPDAPVVGRRSALGTAIGPLAPDAPRLLLPPRAAPLAYARATATAVVTVRSPEGVETMMVLRPQAPPRVVATLNRHLADVPPPRVVAIDTPGPDGGPVRSWIYLPPHRPAGAAPPPLLVRPYLGETYPRPYADVPPPGALFANIRLMVGHGYAVLIPGLPRRTGASDPLAGLAERVLGVVDAAAARSDLAGAFDPDRLGLWGHSYGGYSVLGILTQTRRFRAAVASAPPTNLLGLWGAFQPSWRVAPEDGVWVAWPAGWVETAQGGMGGPPWSAPERYVRASPALLADRIDTPVLLFHGDQDPIPVTQSEQMFSALYRQNKTAELVTYWGEDHLLNSPGTVRDLYARGFAWIDRFVGPGVTATGGAPPANPEAAPATPAPSSR